MEEPDCVNTSVLGSKLAIDTTEKIAGEDFKREWPPLIKMMNQCRRRWTAGYRFISFHTSDSMLFPATIQSALS